MISIEVEYWLSLAGRCSADSQVPCDTYDHRQAARKEREATCHEIDISILMQSKIEE